MNAIDIDYNDLLRNISIAGVSEIPEVGVLMGMFVDTLWPASGQNIWNQIKVAVERLIDRKLDEVVWQAVSDTLGGLEAVSKLYTQTVDGGASPTVIRETWVSAVTTFEGAKVHFQWKGYEVLLLPLFAQFANLELALLRDGLVRGRNWGWNDADVNVYHDKLLELLDTYSQYVDATFSAGKYDANVRGVDIHKHSKKHHKEAGLFNRYPFQTRNEYVRETTLTVLDYKAVWPYYDPIQYPKGEQVELNREIYSDPVGAPDPKADAYSYWPNSAPTLPIQRIEVWSGDRIDSCRVTYPQDGGPNGDTSTGVMGGAHGDNLQHEYDLEHLGQVVKVHGADGQINDWWQFTFQKGEEFTDSKMMGSTKTSQVPPTPFEFSYTDHILSSIYIRGVNSFYRTADCTVFGFKFKKPEALVLRDRKMTR